MFCARSVTGHIKTRAVRITEEAMATPVFERVNPTGAAKLLLLCDHAANFVPEHLAGLGLGEAELARHVGWDFGAAAVTRLLADLLDAPAILSVHSRLVVDCNRALDDPTAMP